MIQMDVSLPGRQVSGAVAATLAYNTPDLVQHLLTELPRCVVFENGSTKRSGEAVVFPINYGFVKGWNIVMRYLAARGATHVWMLNSDVERVSSAMLKALLAVSRCGYAVTTPAFNSPHTIFHPQGNAPWREVRWVDWTLPFVSVDAWLDVGPFDDLLTGYYADVDWCHRARQKGYRFAVLDGQVALHLGSITAQRSGIQWDADDKRIVEKYGVHWGELL